MFTAWINEKQIKSDGTKLASFIECRNNFKS